jgi:DNA-binding IclR family transcriptional regulator
LNSVREASIPFRAVVRPIVTAVGEEVGELCHASLLQGDMLSPVFHFDPQVHGTQVYFDEAEMLPLHATSSGLAVLAFSDGEFIDRVLAGSLTDYTPSTPTDPDFLRTVIAKTRETGFSRLDRAFDVEVSSQGAPIFGPEGNVIGALSVAVPAIRATPEKLNAIQSALGRAADEVTASLGGSRIEATSTNTAGGLRHRM